MSDEAINRAARPEDFRFFSGSALMGPGVRMAAAALVWTLGVGLQLTLGDWGWTWWLGLGLLITGALPLMLKNLSNKPKDQGKEDWRAVTAAEVDRLADALAQSRKLQKKFGGQGCLLFSLFAVMGLGLFMIIGEAGNLGTFLLDSAIFLGAGALGGRAQVFYPGELAMKMAALKPMIDFTGEKGLQMTPYLRFDEDENGKDIPEDIRFMLEPRRRPEDFQGVQFQTAINNGPNGAVPYVYAVFLTKGKDGPTARKLGTPQVSGFVVEKGGDEAWGTLVVRQETTGTGYHTDQGDVRRLLEACTALVNRVMV